MSPNVACMTGPMWVCIIATLVTMTPVRVASDMPSVGAEAVREGLVVRLGDGAEDWQVLVSRTPDPDVAHVRLTSPEGEVIARDLRLVVGDLETRSRSLAAAVSLIIEQHPGGDAETASTPEDAGTDPPSPELAAKPTTVPVEGHVSIAGELSLSHSYDIGGGLGIWGGAWLLGRHLQPVAGLSWFHAQREDLALDAFRFQLGLLGGAQPIPPLWVGAGVTSGAQWLRASAQGAAQTWSSVTRLPVVVQLRRYNFLATLSTGAELLLPPVRARSDNVVLRLRPVRFFLSVAVGGVF